MCVCVHGLWITDDGAVGNFVERKRKRKSTCSGKEKDALCLAAVNVMHQECDRRESEGEVCEVSVMGGRVKEKGVR